MSLISRSTNYSNNVNLYNELNDSINEIDVFVSGNKSKKDVREKDIETISDRLGVAARGLNSSKPLIRETKHLTAYNSPIEDIFDKYVPL